MGKNGVFIKLSFFPRIGLGISSHVQDAVFPFSSKAVMQMGLLEAF